MIKPPQSLTGISISLIIAMVLGFASWAVSSIGSNTEDIQDVRVDVSATKAQLKSINDRTVRIEDKIDQLIYE